MNANDLLPEICLLPPPLGTRWTGASTTHISETPDGQKAEPWPLFWYDPPWNHLPPEIALGVVSAVDALRIPVTVMGRDLGLDDLAAAQLQFAMIPYRPDRYGLAVDDLQSAHCVDLRLARVRNELGRYAYSSGQIQRWLGHKADARSRNLGMTIPAPGWPAELSSLSELTGKLQQLRTLNRSATCVISVSPYRLAEELPGVVEVGPDAVILRMDDSDEIVGNHLARIVVQAKAILDQASEDANPVRLWLVLPYEPTPADCVKLFALGASAVAVDWWCQPLIRIASELAAQSGSLPEAEFAAQVSSLLKPRMNRLAGLTSSCGLSQPNQLNRSHLGTTDHAFARQSGLTPIGPAPGHDRSGPDDVVK